MKPITIKTADNETLDLLAGHIEELHRKRIGFGEVSYEVGGGKREYFRPSTSANQIATIQKRERIALTPVANNMWQAYKVDGVMHTVEGVEPFVAILRRYLLSKYGGNTNILLDLS